MHCRQHMLPLACSTPGSLTLPAPTTPSPCARGRESPHGDAAARAQRRAVVRHLQPDPRVGVALERQAARQAHAAPALKPVRGGAQPGVQPHVRAALRMGVEGPGALCVLVTWNGDTHRETGVLVSEQVAQTCCTPSCGPSVA